MSRGSLSRVPRPLASLLALALIVALAGCGEKDEPDPTSITSTTTATTPMTSPPAGSGLEVVVEPSSASAGSTLTATVNNGTEKEFTYGAAYEIDRAIAGGWEPVELPPRAVIEIAYVAPPGGSGGAIDVELPADLEPGLYRVVIARDVPDVGDLVGEFRIPE